MNKCRCLEKYPDMNRAAAGLTSIRGGFGEATGGEETAEVLGFFPCVPNAPHIANHLVHFFSGRLRLCAGILRC